MMRIFDWLDITFDEGVVIAREVVVNVTLLLAGPHVGGAYGPYVQVIS